MDLEALERLSRLRDSGVLTDDEFQIQKDRILSQQGHRQASAEIASGGWSGWEIIRLVAALFIVAGIVAFFLLRASPDPVSETALTFKSPCVGAYSDVGFSKYTGDGSGWFVRVPSTGNLTVHSWEGGRLVPDVEVTSASADRIQAKLRFAGAYVTNVELLCRQNELVVKQADSNSGNSTLRRLTELEAAELEGDSEGSAPISSPTSQTAEASSTTETAAAGFTYDEQKLIDAYLALEEECRGGSGEGPKCESWADGTNIEGRRLLDASICRGREGQSNSEYEHHRCESDSIR